MKRNVFTVTHLSAYGENFGYIVEIFDTEEAARAYVQTRIDTGRRKHKKTTVVDGASGTVKYLRTIQVKRKSAAGMVTISHCTLKDTA